MTFKELRDAAGLRQVDIARKLRVDQSAVSHWELGKTKPVRKYHKPLANMLGCTVDDLLQAVTPEAQGE